MVEDQSGKVVVVLCATIIHHRTEVVLGFPLISGINGLTGLHVHV